MTRFEVWKRKMAKEKRKKSEGFGGLAKYSAALRQQLVDAGYYGPFK